MTSIQDLHRPLKGYAQAEIERILQAARFSERVHAGQLRDSGDPYFTHPLNVAAILLDMRLDSATIIAGLLHDALEDTAVNLSVLRTNFGREVAMLVNGVTKIAQVHTHNRGFREAETVRKMLLAMVKDVRVILIKLADKLHNMRTLQFKQPERRREIAGECLDIYAPLADRLGISQFKNELENLALRHLDGEITERIERYVSEQASSDGSYLRRATRAIAAIATEHRMSLTIETRLKHTYSIYTKMKQQNCSVNEIHDLLGVRLLCGSTTDCYTMLGLVHQLWPPIEGRFKDYIAMPKANKYQSLHTTLLCMDGRQIEIQIRTHDMHRTAEHGIAAHWLYKRNNRRSSGRTKVAISPKELTIMRQVRSMDVRNLATTNLLDDIKRDLLKDSIYLFTPKGDVIQLPHGATAIDFAYHIHTDIGHHAWAAKADGAIIPLRAELKNTQVIEVITSPKAQPTLNWLRWVRTARARSKIRAWLNKHDENLIIDQSVVARKQHDHPHHTTLRRPKRTTARRSLGPPQVRVADDDKIMIQFASCCSPNLGDNIIGYISRGRGIIVHRSDCHNLQGMEDLVDRSIEVEWETVSPLATYRLQVVAHKTADLFSEIERAVRNCCGGNLIEGRVEEGTNGDLEGWFTVEVGRSQSRHQLLRCIYAVQTVTHISE